MRNKNKKVGYSTAAAAAAAAAAATCKRTDGGIEFLYHTVCEPHAVVSRLAINVTAAECVELFRSVFNVGVRVMATLQRYNPRRPLDSVLGLRYSEDGLIIIPLFDKHEIARGYLVLGDDGSGYNGVDYSQSQCNVNKHQYSAAYR